MSFEKFPPVTPGDVVGPASATDLAIVIFDGITGKLVKNSLVTIGATGVVGLPDNIRQIFNPGADESGLNVGQHTADPSTPVNGDIYYDSTNDLLRARINGAWVSLGAGGSGSQIYQKGVTVDGGGSAITTGVKGYASIPVSGTITKVRLLADQAGNAVVDIWLDDFANYPPTVADTITAAAKPTLTAANSYEDTTLTGWTTAVTAGQVLGFNIDSAATITRLTVELEITP